MHLHSVHFHLFRKKKQKRNANPDRIRHRVTLSQHTFNPSIATRITNMSDRLAHTCTTPEKLVRVCLHMQRETHTHNIEWIANVKTRFAHQPAHPKPEKRQQQQQQQFFVHRIHHHCWAHRHALTHSHSVAGVQSSSSSLSDIRTGTHTRSVHRCVQTIQLYIYFLFFFWISKTNIR